MNDYGQADPAPIPRTAFDSRDQGALRKSCRPGLRGRCHSIVAPTGVGDLVQAALIDKRPSLRMDKPSFDRSTVDGRARNARGSRFARSTVVRLRFLHLQSGVLDADNLDTRKWIWRARSPGADHCRALR